MLVVLALLVSTYESSSGDAAPETVEALRNRLLANYGSSETRPGEAAAMRMGDSCGAAPPEDVEARREPPPPQPFHRVLGETPRPRRRTRITDAVLRQDEVPA